MKNYLKGALRRRENLVLILTGLIVSVAILYPLGIVIFTSFKVQKGLFLSVFSLSNYARLASPVTLGALKNSFVIGLGSALLSGAIGITLAWITARTNVPFRTSLQAMNMIPFFMSPLIGAIAWSLLASPKTGLLTKAIMTVFSLEQAPFNIFSLGGIILVLGLFRAPFVYLFCIGPLRHMDPSLEEAARTAGSNWLGTTFRVTAPLISPAIFSALILTFVLSVEELGAVLILGLPYKIQTIATLIFAGINSYPSDFGFGAVLGVLIMVLTGAAVLLQSHIMKSRSFITVTGRGYRPVQIKLGWGRYAALAFNIAYLLVAVILPIFALIIVSLQRAWTGQVEWELFTRQYYTYIFTVNPIAIRGIVNSLMLSTVAATLSIALAVVVAYGIHRTRSWARGWLDVITTVPMGVSGLVFGVGLLVALIRTPLYATLSILLVAYVVRFFTYGQRSVSGVLVSVSMDLEESSRTSGANWFTTMRRILVPLTLPGLVGGWLLLFITYMREVSMSLLLSRSGTETISVALYSMLAFDAIGSVAALTVVQVAILLVAVFIFLRLAGDKGIRV